MPKINLSFDEFLDVVGTMRLRIDELRERGFTTEAVLLENLYNELQLRYARATVEAELHTEEVP